MDINGVLSILLPIVFIAVGIVLVLFIVELIKMVKAVRTTIDDVNTQIKPMLANVNDITGDIKPAIAKVDPLMDRVQLTVDSLNLEMMRVDKILEDVGEITDTASSATAAVDNLTNAPLHAVNNVASRVRSAFGSKNASAESEQLAEQRVAVAQALEDYKAAESESAKKGEGGLSNAAPASKDPTEPIVPVRTYDDDGSPVAGAEPVIDPKVIAESPFFDSDDDAR